MKASLFSLYLGSSVLVSLFSCPSQLGCCPFKQILSCVVVQTAFAEMFAVKSLTLVIQENCQPVERVVTLLRYYDISLWNSVVFFTDSVHDDVFLFPFKHIDCKIRILFSRLSICETQVLSGFLK